VECPTTTEEINAVVQTCLQRGKKRFPRIFPSIYNAEDALSDFLYGVAIGIKKVKQWERADPIAFLVQNGIYSIRVRRFRALGKRLIISCECGKRLKMSQAPCHGTKDTRMIHAGECYVGVSPERPMVGIESFREDYT